MSITHTVKTLALLTLDAPSCVTITASWGEEPASAGGEGSEGVPHVFHTATAGAHSLTHSVVYIVRKMLEQFFLRLWMTLGQGEFLCVSRVSLTRCVLTLVC